MLAAAHPCACCSTLQCLQRPVHNAIEVFQARRTRYSVQRSSDVFRANACGFRDDKLHFMCSTNIWLASSWCMCWLHLLRVSCFRLSPSLPRGCQCCETAAVRIHGCEFSLSLSHPLSPSSSLARCLSQFLSLPLYFPLFLLFCLSLSLGWVIGWECVRERETESECFVLY